MSASGTPNQNDTQISGQRIAIAVGTVVIVILTIAAALFLAMNDMPDETPTPIAQIEPTTTATASPPVATATFTAIPASPTTKPATSLPTLPTDTPSPLPATSTPTPSPLPPSDTPTQAVIIVTATSLPAATPVEATQGGTCQPPSNWIIYPVEVGDTLQSLAARTDSSVTELQKYNCLSSATLQPGQQIYLPFVPPTPTSVPTATTTPRPGPSPTRSPTPLRPQIDSVVPNQVDRATADSDVLITVVGQNFQPEARDFRVDLRGPASVELTIVNRGSSTSFDALVPAGLPDGTYDMVVTNFFDRAGTRPSAFTIGPPVPTTTPSPAPDVIRFTPTSGKISEEIILTVQGLYFAADQTGFKVELQAISGSFRHELDLGNIRTDTNFTAIIKSDTLERGDYNLVISNPDGRSDIASDRYRAID
jgi:LysM repeat protein